MIIIYGAGGHGGVILEILESQNLMACFFDDDPVKTEYLETKVLKSIDTEKVIIGIGENTVRRHIANSLNNSCFEIAIDKSANISPRATIDVGSVVFTGANINHSTTIGKHVIINTNASVDHNCSIGDFSHIAPGATICGGVTIGQEVLVGAGATILPNLTIGNNVTIGAGALVTKNIIANQQVSGIPARIKDNKNR